MVRNSDTILSLLDISYQSENQKERIFSTLLRFLAQLQNNKGQDILTYQKMYVSPDKFDEQYWNCSLYIDEHLPHLE